MQARKEAANIVEQLCAAFGQSANSKKDMLQIFDKYRCRNLKVGAVAVFLAFVRRDQASRKDGEVVTLRQVASFAGVPLGKVAAALKSVPLVAERKFLTKQEPEGEEEGEEEFKPTGGAMTNIPGLVRCVYSSYHFADPFTGLDMTSRVLRTTEQILELIQRHSSRSWEPNYTCLAAGCLAWQSTFFYQSAHLKDVPSATLQIPKEMGSLKEFLATVNAPSDKLDPVGKRLMHVLRELMELLKKMTWIRLPAKGSLKRLVPQYLVDILQHQELTCEVLSQEAQARRQEEAMNQPAPIIPRGELLSNL